MKPDIYVSDTGRAWGADEHPELASTHKGYYTAEQLKSAKAEVLREAAEILDRGADWELYIPIIRRMADELEK